MKLHRRNCALFLLLLLMASLGVCSVPPHPRVRQMIRNGQIALPYHLANPADAIQRGINAYPPIMPKGFTPFSASALPLNRTFRAIVLLVQFSDSMARVQPVFFDSLLYATSSTSLRDYYEEVSYGTLDLVTVNFPSSLGWSMAPQPYSYYVNRNNGFGVYPRNVQKLVEDVILAADPFVDFSQYDNNGDGFVDALFIVHAGPGAEFTGNSNDIWSHKWYTSHPMNVDGVSAYTYSTEPEYWERAGDMTCGVYAHEAGHAIFGLPDLYDTGYDSQGLGDWSLMASGSWLGPLFMGESPGHPDAWSRSVMGFANPVNVTKDTLGASFPAIVNDGTIYRLWTAGAQGSEYFLVENRQKIGYDSYIPGEGLCVYHIDENEVRNDHQWYPGYTDFGHYKVALEQADGLWNLERNLSYGNAGDCYPGSTGNSTFNFGSTPNSQSYLFDYTGVTIRNISPSGLTMTADLLVMDTPVLYGVMLSANPPGSGRVSKSPDKKNYLSGDSVRLNASSFFGYHFVNWSGDVPAGHQTDNPLMLVLDTNKTLIANFELNRYKIVASAGSHGSIEPSGEVLVTHGRDTTFTIMPEANYRIDSIIVNGVYCGREPNYTFHNVQQDFTIRAVFAVNKHHIVATSGPHGSILPADTVIVDYGTHQRFVFNPDPNYSVDSVIADGVNCPDSLEGFTFANIQADHHIHVIFGPATVTISVKLSRYWNMVSLPAHVDDRRRGSVFPEAISHAYTYEDMYMPKDTLTVASGYWLKLSSAGEIGLRGKICMMESVKVKEGWNMIGSLSTLLPVEKISSNPAGIVTSEFFAYNGHYDQTDTLFPGKGYWVKVSRAGSLLLSASGCLAAEARIQIVASSEVPPQPPSREVTDDIVPVQARFELVQNYPNPFNPTTRIRYELAQNSTVQVSVFNTLGQQVAILVQGEQEAGFHEVEFDAAGLTSGVYFYRLTAGSFTETKKLILLR